MDVHPINNVSIGIDPYPYIKIPLYTLLRIGRWPGFDLINTVTRAIQGSKQFLVAESRAYLPTSKTRAELINATYCDTSTRNSNETRPCPDKL